MYILYTEVKVHSTTASFYLLVMLECDKEMT